MVAHNRIRYLEDGKLRCPACDELKELSEYHKDKRRPYGAAHKCKDCTNAYVRKRHAEHFAPGKARNHEHRRYHKAYQLRRIYGITIDEYNAKLTEQGGKCAICSMEVTFSRDLTAAHLDHCHATGKVRGILCVRCNQGIGFLQDRIDLLYKAIDYLKEYGEIDEQA